MTMAQAAESVEYQLGRIEGRIDSFATKEDLAHLEARLTRWMVGMMLSSAGIATSAALVIARFT